MYRRPISSAYDALSAYLQIHDQYMMSPFEWLESITKTECHILGQLCFQFRCHTTQASCLSPSSRQRLHRGCTGVSRESALLFSLVYPPSLFNRVLRFYLLFLPIIMSSLNNMQYSKANTEDDYDSRESLLSDEGPPLYQLEKNAKKWRRILLISLHLLGTAVACLAAGLAGYYWHRDLDGICTSHASETCKFLLLLETYSN